VRIKKSSKLERVLIVNKKLILVLLYFIVSCSQEDIPREYDLDSTVILISLDGFRWDYLSKADTPNLDLLKNIGASAESLRPVFPSKTFPNHLSIVTGCYPENHGIISNYMYDPVWDAEYYIGENSEPVKDPRWYDREPIWVTAEKQGKLTGTYFWPGSEADINGVRPTYYGVYDGSIPNEDRVQKILGWIDLPKINRPVFMTLYFSDADGWGHDYGPDAIEMSTIIKELDDNIGLLINGLMDRNILEDINIIITSDHGMSAHSRDRVIFLDDYINTDSVRVLNWSPVTMLLSEDESIDTIFNSLNGVHPQMSVYKKENIPERLHFKNHYRIPPIICIAEDGWSITDHDYFNDRPTKFTGGGHGYDPINRSMHGILIAHGPALKEGVSINSITNIHIYELIAHILDIDALETDASFDSISVMLR